MPRTRKRVSRTYVRKTKTAPDPKAPQLPFGMHQVSVWLPDLTYHRVMTLTTARGLPLSDLVVALLTKYIGSEIVYNLDDDLMFGQYSGQPLRTIIKTDPRYIQWLLRDSSRFKMSQEAHAYLYEIAMPKYDDIPY